MIHDKRKLYFILLFFFLSCNVLIAQKKESKSIEEATLDKQNRFLESQMKSSGAALRILNDENRRLEEENKELREKGGNVSIPKPCNCKPDYKKGVNDTKKNWKKDTIRIYQQVRSLTAGLNKSESTNRGLDFTIKGLETDLTERNDTIKVRDSTIVYVETQKEKADSIIDVRNKQIDNVGQNFNQNGVKLFLAYKKNQLSKKAVFIPINADLDSKFAQNNDKSGRFRKQKIRAARVVGVLLAIDLVDTFSRINLNYSIYKVEDNSISFDSCSIYANESIDLYPKPNQLGKYYFYSKEHFTDSYKRIKCRREIPRKKEFINFIKGNYRLKYEINTQPQNQAIHFELN